MFLFTLPGFLTVVEATSVQKDEHPIQKDASSFLQLSINTTFVFGTKLTEISSSFRCLVLTILILVSFQFCGLVKELCHPLYTREEISNLVI